MRKVLLILVSYALLLAASVKGQCPDRDVLWKKMIYLKTSRISPKDQLAELLGYLGKMDKCSYRNDSTHAYLLRQIGNIYFQQADYLKAVQYRRQAIDIITANAGKPSVKIKDLPGCYYYLSVVYDALNNFGEKMKALDSCSTIAIRINYVDRSSLTALYNQVEFYFDAGDYHRCIDYAEKCRSFGREYANNNTGDRITGESFASSSLGWQVNALLKLNKYQTAEELLKNKIDEYKKAGLKDYLGLAYWQLADVQQQKGNFKEALFYFNQSLKFYQEINDYFNCKQTIKDIGYTIYFRHFKDGDKALAYYRKALQYVVNKNEWGKEDTTETLNIFTLIANVFVQKGYYDSAYHYFQLAFDQIKPGTSEKDVLLSSPEKLAEYKNKHYFVSLFISKGDGFKQQYKTTRDIGTIRNAVLVYKYADQLLDKIRTEQTDLKSKLFWRNDTRRLYENAIEACYLQHNFEDAFYFFEKSRAVLLYDQLNQQKWLGGNDILKQTELQKKILKTDRELNKTDKNSKIFSELQSELFISKHELDVLQQQIKTDNPLYYQNYLDTGVISLRNFKQKVLSDHQALVEIFAGDSVVYALIVTEKQSKLLKINKTAFDSLSAAYTRYISNGALLNSNLTAFKNISHNLHQLIFQNTQLPAGRIIISPDVNYFPFESLVTSNTDEPLKYFLTDYAVSYTYSARYLLNVFNSVDNKKSLDFLGIAPVKYPSGFNLAALPGSELSLQKMQDYFDDPEKLVAVNASRSKFLNNFYRYKIVQMYTHSADSGYNGEPIIYFADSALLLSDLFYENKPATRLIVLSACETGTGNIYKGEGVFSFNRGFAALGIPAAISNLWSVDNESTYHLTELFYKQLSKGLPTDIALQKAKLEFMQTASKEKSLPYYWAGPVLVGKTDIIELSKPLPWKWIVFFAGIGFVIFWAIRRRLFSGART